MKKIIGIIALLLLTIYAFGQEASYDIVEVKEELYIRGDSTLIDVINANSDPTADTVIAIVELEVRDTAIIDLIEEHSLPIPSFQAINGITVTSTPSLVQYRIGGDFTSNTNMDGRGYNLNFGWPNYFGTFRMGSEDGMYFYNDNLVSFEGYNGNKVIWDGDLFSVKGDEVATTDDIRDSIQDNLPILPFNFDYTLDAAIDNSRPGVGLIKLNSATQAAVTKIYIDDYAKGTVNVRQFIQTADTGSLFYIQESKETDNYLMYEITGSVGDSSSYTSYEVTYLYGGIGSVPYSATNSVLFVGAKATGSSGGGSGGVDSLFFVSNGTYINDTIPKNDSISDEYTVSDTLRIGNNILYTETYGTGSLQVKDVLSGSYVDIGDDDGSDAVSIFAPDRIIFSTSSGNTLYDGDYFIVKGADSLATLRNIRESSGDIGDKISIDTIESGSTGHVLINPVNNLVIESEKVLIGDVTAFSDSYMEWDLNNSSGYFDLKTVRADGRNTNFYLFPSNFDLQGMDASSNIAKITGDAANSKVSLITNYGQAVFEDNTLSVDNLKVDTSLILGVGVLKDTAVGISPIGEIFSLATFDLLRLDTAIINGDTITGGSKEMSMYLYNGTVTLTATQNIFAIITGLTEGYNQDNYFTVLNDSVQLLSSDYAVDFNISYSGSNTDNYQGALFLDGVEVTTGGGYERGMSGSDNGVIAGSWKGTVSSTSYLSFRIQNTANNNDPTITYMNISIRKIK